MTPTIQADRIFSFTLVSASSVDKYPGVGLSPQRNTLIYLIKDSFGIPVLIVSNDLSEPMEATILVDKHSPTQHGTIICSKHGNLMCDIFDVGLLLFTLSYYCLASFQYHLHSWDFPSPAKEDIPSTQYNMLICFWTSYIISYIIAAIDNLQDITLQKDSFVFFFLLSIASHLQHIISHLGCVSLKPICSLEVKLPPTDRSPVVPSPVWSFLALKGCVRWVPFGCHYHRWTFLFGHSEFSENATDRQNDDMLTLPKKLTKSNGPQNKMMGLSVRKDNGTLTKIAIFGINSFRKPGESGDWGSQGPKSSSNFRKYSPQTKWTPNVLLQSAFYKAA